MQLQWQNLGTEGITVRKEYRNAVQRLFAVGLQRRFPAYATWKPLLPPIVKGDGKAFFRRAVGSRACVFIVLAPHCKQDDAFFVELGWSAHDRVPDVHVWPSAFATPERRELEQPEGVIRLGDLDGSGGMWSTGALERAMAAGDQAALLAHLEHQIRPLSPAEAEAEMQPLVEAALEAVERVGVAFLDAAAEVLARAGGPRSSS